MASMEEQRLQALHRFEIIRPSVEEGVCQTEIARVSGIPLKTVQRWIRSYRGAGLSGLARKVRSDAGQPRGLPQDLVLLVEGLAQTKASTAIDEHSCVGEPGGPGAQLAPSQLCPGASDCRAAAQGSCDAGAGRSGGVSRSL